MCLQPITIRTHPNNGVSEVVTVKCGNCLQCAQQYSREWSFRIMQECSFYNENCFLTLTYNEYFLPSDGSVSRREVQLFIKRLRKKLYPVKIRFFACGEYGSKRGRPHYHLIIFGWKPNDLQFLKYDGKVPLYRSKIIEEVWTFGFSSVGDVNFDTALYCSKYMQKFEFQRYHNSDNRLPPFIQMSNRPGIGYNAVYSSDLVSDRVYCYGRSFKIPRYYLKVMERDGVFLDDFKERRIRDGVKISQSKDLFSVREKYFNKFLKKS